MRVELATSMLRAAADGQEAVELNATTIRELYADLTRQYPRFQTLTNKGVAIAINGRIFQDDWNTPIPADAELVLLPYIEGG